MTIFLGFEVHLFVEITEDSTLNFSIVIGYEQRTIMRLQKKKLAGLCKFSLVLAVQRFNLIVEQRLARNLVEAAASTAAAAETKKKTPLRAVSPAKSPKL